MLDIEPNPDKPFYMVLTRHVFAGMGFVTLIMLLRDQYKAESLAKFLTTGQYFEDEVIVEAFSGMCTPEEIKDRLKADLINTTLE